MPELAIDPGGAEVQGSGKLQITDDLVRKVADKVLALLLLELRIERERRHLRRGGARLPRGGRV